MFPTPSFSTVAIALGVVAIGTFGLFAYQHYNNLVNTVATLQADNASLIAAVDAQMGAIDAQQAALVEWRQAQQALMSRLDEVARIDEDAAAYARRLNDVFAEHDLARLASERPGLVETRANDGTAELFRLFECATGASGDDCPDRGGPTGPETADSQP